MFHFYEHIIIESINSLHKLRTLKDMEQCTMASNNIKFKLYIKFEKIQFKTVLSW